MFGKGIKAGLVLGMVCLCGLLIVREVRAEDFGVFKEGKGVVLKVDGQKFGVGAACKCSWKNDWLYIENVAADTHYVRAFCTVVSAPGKGQWSVPANYIQEIKVVVDKEDEKVVYIKAKAYNHSEKKIMEPYCMEMNLRIKKGFPCLFIYQRVTNPSDDSPKSFSFISYARNLSIYAVAGSEINEVPKIGSLVGKNWLFAKRGITEKTEGSKGLGIISSTFGSGRGGQIYWGITKGTVEEGGSLECKYAVMAADTPEEVKVLYEKIKDVKLDPFLVPGESSADILASAEEKTSPAVSSQFTAKQGKINDQSNKLVIDLVKLAPYAQWNNYYGKIKFGHYQKKTGCALYRDGASKENWSCSRGYYKKEDKELGKGETKSIFTVAHHEAGYVRGKYPLFLPKAEKLLFESKVKGSAPVSMGYFLKGEGTKYLVKDKNIRWTKKPIKCDLTHLSGQRCNILLKIKGISVRGSITNWNNTRIIALYPEKGMPDLAVSPSDIEIVPLADGRVDIEVTIHNIAKTDTDKFQVDLYDGANLLGKKEVFSLKGREKVSLNWQSLKISEGEHEIAVRIISSTEENSKENNSAILVCKFPVWGIMFKDIEGYPYNWRAEDIKINLTNSLTETADYKLECKITDYWGKEIKHMDYDIPLNADTVTIKPFDNKRIGWCRMETSIVYKDKIVDSLSADFCKVPMPPAKAQRDAIFQIFHTCWSTLPMIKDTGASYVQGGNWKHSTNHKKQASYDGRAISAIDKIIKQGQIPYVMILQNLASKKMELSKRVEEAKNFGYKQASKYPHKKTGIWWYIMGERNRKISPHDYAAIVRAFYEGAIKADPDVRIATMELSGTHPSLLDSGKRGTQFEWLAEMYPQARGCFHAVGNANYSHLAPEEPFHNYRVKPFIDIIEKHGDLGKISVHLQEGNVSGGPGVMVRMYLYQLGLKERGASIVDWFCIQDYWIPVGIRWGICKFNRHPKAEYQAYAVMTRELTGAKFVEKKDIGEDSYCYVFKKGRDTLACLWKGKGEKEVIVVPAKRKVEITNVMGETVRIKPDKKSVRLTISSDPIYVRGLDLRHFKVISRYDFGKIISFEDKYPDACRLLTMKSMKSCVYYNMAEANWLNGKSGIQKLIDDGLNATASKPLPAKDTVIAKYFSKPITIDGSLSEWQGSPSYNVSGSEHWTGSGKHTGEKDLSYTFQAGWDKDNLYFAFNVKDDVVISKYSSLSLDGYGGDCVETYIDVLNKRSHIQDRGTEFSQHYFGLNNKIGRIGGSGKILANMAWKKTIDGYNMEIAFPLEEIFLEGLNPGYRIAFSVHIDDSDKVVDVKGALLWRREGFESHTACGAADLLFAGETQ